MVKALVLRVEGTNCDQELVNAFELAGAEVTLAHMNQLVKKKVSIEDHQILGIPGGFAHGDDISAGKLFANQLRYLTGKDVKAFIEEGKPVIGICNGFQVLVKTGFLPDLQGMQKQEATLAFNSSGIFRDEWVRLKPQEGNRCGFLNKIEKEVYVPIAHAEGRFIAEDRIISELEENKQVVFKYVDNPNGSMNDIAGICNAQGNVFGMMPHPERYLHPWMHPRWTRELPPEGDGLQFFKNIVEYAKR